MAPTQVSQTRIMSDDDRFVIWSSIWYKRCSGRNCGDFKIKYSLSPAELSLNLHITHAP